MLRSSALAAPAAPLHCGAASKADGGDHPPKCDLSAAPCSAHCPERVQGCQFALPRIHSQGGQLQRPQLMLWFNSRSRSRLDTSSNGVARLQARCTRCTQRSCLQPAGKGVLRNTRRPGNLVVRLLTIPARPMQPDRYFFWKKLWHAKRPKNTNWQFTAAGAELQQKGGSCAC